MQLLNALRNRPGAAVAAPLAAVDRSVILNERLFELLGEGKRRQDLIRFGGYTARTDSASALRNGKGCIAGPTPQSPCTGWTHSTADYRVLFPIPQSQIDANAQLKQNPGY